MGLHVCPGVSIQPWTEKKSRSLKGFSGLYLAIKVSLTDRGLLFEINEICGIL